MEQNYKYLRLFPLTLVVFPHENLNLHIFEPRYKQLINECLASGDTFGIPVFKDEKMEMYGTEIEILSVEEVYDGGEMDIKTRGKSLFEIKDIILPNEDCLYTAGNIVTIDFDESEDDTVRVKLEDLIRDFYSIVSPQTEVSFNSKAPLSDYYGHKIGLSFRQEYELLRLTTEYERQSYMLQHLMHVLPILQETELLKDRIKQNGHFKKLTANGMA